MDCAARRHHAKKKFKNNKCNKFSKKTLKKKRAKSRKVKDNRAMRRVKKKPSTKKCTIAHKACRMIQAKDVPFTLPGHSLLLTLLVLT